MHRTILAFALVVSTPRAVALELDWLAGDWCGASSGTQSRETWTTSAGGVLVGLHKDRGSDGRTSFEFLRIELDGAHANYFAQPGGAAPTRFELSASERFAVSFANPQHDFPQRIHYRRDGERLLVAIDDGSQHGQSMHWEWKACGSSER